MTTIYLVRHGQTRSNVSGYHMGWSDEDLNSTGVAQVQSLASRLARLPITSVYTSPLQRAYSTAHMLAEPHVLVPDVLDDLIEIKLGDWQGLHRSEIKQKWKELWNRWQTEPSGVTLPNGESFKLVAERAVRGFERIIEGEHDKHVVVVTHEIVVKILACHILGAGYKIYRRFEIGNASLSVAQITGARMRLITLNDTAHLGENNQ